MYKCLFFTHQLLLCESWPSETVPVIVIVSGLLMLAGLRSSVWYSSRQPTTCAGVGGSTRMCAADTDCTQHHDPVEPRPQHVCKRTTGLTSVGPTSTDVHGQNGSCSLIQLLQLLHHCGCDTVQHIETSPARSQATSPKKHRYSRHHRHNTVDITDATHITDKTMHDRHNYCNSTSLALTAETTDITHASRPK